MCTLTRRQDEMEGFMRAQGDPTKTMDALGDDGKMRPMRTASPEEEIEWWH